MMPAQMAPQPQMQMMAEPLGSADTTQYLDDYTCCFNKRWCKLKKDAMKPNYLENKKKAYEGKEAYKRNL